MGRQSSILKIEATIGGISFYKNKDDGYLVREKTGVDGERMKIDPAFETVHKNYNEFGRASKAAGLTLKAFRCAPTNSFDSKAISRLLQRMSRVLKTDVTHEHGQRMVTTGDLTLLEGYNFNRHAMLEATLRTDFKISVERENGRSIVNIPSFIPNDSPSAPAGATHYNIVVVAAEIDFKKNTFVCDMQKTGELMLDENETSDIRLETWLPMKSRLPFFLALGINFTQVVNGKAYALQDGVFNSLSLVRVSTDR